MTLSSEILADSPMGFWKFNETSGPTIADSSGHGLNGTYPGSGVTLGYAAGPPLTGDLGARFTGGIGTIANVPNFTGAFTVEAWVRRISDSSFTYPGILELGVSQNYTGMTGWMFYFDEDPGLQSWALKKNSAGGEAPTSGANTALAGQLHHVVVTSDPSTHTVLWTVDNVVTNTFTYDYGAPFATTDWLYVGVNEEYHNSVNDFLISYAAIYDHVLSPTRINAHFLAGTTGIATGTEATFYTYENIGPSLLFRGEAEAYAYSNITDALPAPYIWYLYPAAAYRGQQVAVVGTGFGDTELEYMGKALFGGSIPTLVSWFKVDAGPNAYDVARRIDPLTDVSSMEHDRVVFVVPDNAVSANVVIAIDSSVVAPIMIRDGDTATGTESVSLMATITSTESAAGAEAGVLMIFAQVTQTFTEVVVKPLANAQVTQTFIEVVRQ